MGIEEKLLLLVGLVRKKLNLIHKALVILMLFAKILGLFVRQDLERMAQALLQNVMKVVIRMEDASLQLLREQEELEGEDYKLHHVNALMALHLYQFQSQLHQFQSQLQPHHQLHLVTHLEQQMLIRTHLKVTNGNVGVIVTIKLLQVLVLICLKTMIKLEEQIMSKPLYL